MGRPTLLDQLAKAVADGDLPLAQSLVKKISNKPKPKVSVKPKTTKKVKTQVIVDDNDDSSRKEEGISPANIKDPFDDFITTAKSSQSESYSYTDEDGNERVRARVVPFKVVKNRKNKWKDDLTEAVSDIEFDKKKKHLKLKKRPDVKKIKVECCRCHKDIEVWPGEVLHENWACDKCLVKNKGGTSE